MRYASALVAALALAACGETAEILAPEDPPAEILPPIVRVTASTTGPGDPEYAYRVHFDDTNAMWVIPGEAAEFYAVRDELQLTGLAPGCTAAGNPRTIALTGYEVSVHFDVTCTAPPPPVAAVGIVSVNAYHLVAFDATGRSARVLGGGVSPAWSPDGERIAFVSSLDPTRRIVVLDPDAMTAETISGGFSSDASLGQLLAWHPEGDRIAFGAGSEIRILDVAGGAHATLSPNLGRVLNVDWSPAGDSLAVSSDSGIALVSADGSGRRVLPGSQGYWDAAPSWAPAGGRIAIARSVIWYPICPCGPGIGFGFPMFDTRATHRTGDNLMIAATDGSAARDLFATAEGGGYAWSPDGSRIAYTGYEWSVNVASPDGMTTLPLGVTGIPSWTADGRIRVHGEEGISLFAADGSWRTVVAGGETLIRHASAVAWR